MDVEAPPLAATLERLGFVLAEIPMAPSAGMHFNRRERGIEGWEAVSSDCPQGFESFTHRHDFELPIIALHELAHGPAEQIGQAPRGFV